MLGTGDHWSLPSHSCPIQCEVLSPPTRGGVRGSAFWVVPLGPARVRSPSCAPVGGAMSQTRVYVWGELPPSCSWTRARGQQGNPSWRTFRAHCSLTNSHRPLRDFCAGRHTQTHRTSPLLHCCGISSITTRARFFFSSEAQLQKRREDVKH